ncbi:MAG: amidohydrolase, partial [Verrucomicrobia bacterium]|nr:amidohydrolase [Verrucomicrobiota bacterium]
MQEIIKKFLGPAIEMRHHLHQIPELKYEERKTSAFIAETLTSYGYEVQQGVGGTGVVGLLDSGHPGKTLAFRA